MSACTGKPTFTLGAQPTYGTPDPRYIRPLARINSMVADMPQGYLINPCLLPMEAITEAVSAELLAAGTEPAPMVDAEIPTSVIGEDTYLLGKPAQWIALEVEGVVYNIAGYTA